jgi:hypothetical protein
MKGADDELGLLFHKEHQPLQAGYPLLSNRERFKQSFIPWIYQYKHFIIDYSIK